MDKKKLVFRVARSLVATGIVFASACEDKPPPPPNSVDEKGQSWWIHPDRTRRTYPPSEAEQQKHAEEQRKNEKFQEAQGVRANPVEF